MCLAAVAPLPTRRAAPPRRTDRPRALAGPVVRRAQPGPALPRLLSPGQFVEVLAVGVAEVLLPARGQRPQRRPLPGGARPELSEKVTSRYRVEGCDGACRRSRGRGGARPAGAGPRAPVPRPAHRRGCLTCRRSSSPVRCCRRPRPGSVACGAEHQGSIDDLRVIADRPTSTGPTTLLIANTGADTTVHVRFDGIEHRLWQFAPEVEHATGYVWGPLHADPQLEIDASGTSLQAEVPVRGPVEHLRTSVVTDELDPGLFEGRTRSLRFLDAGVDAVICSSVRRS